MVWFNEDCMITEGVESMKKLQERETEKQRQAPLLRRLLARSVENPGHVARLSNGSAIKIIQPTLLL